MKKYILFLVSLYFVFITNVFASSPTVVCGWLPGCEDGNAIWWKSFFSFIWNVISTWIKFVAVIAVISLVLAWMMYILSAWEDEKVKKAKSWIIWSLVWVLISTSAWALVNVANNFRIN